MNPSTPRHGDRGFTLMELLVTLTVMALAFAIVLPNLGAFVPEAKLDGSANRISRTLDRIRSEARIQARPMHLELDLRNSQWRVVWPPEEQLTRDQDVTSLEERLDEWQYLETGVKFAGVGDANKGLATSGLYRVTFDEYGFTADQVIVLKLDADQDMVWSLQIDGLSGRTRLERSESGEMLRPVAVNEGAF
ncbi:MAG: hypothetical protein RL398_2873 [Planctomycetota bacterium]